MQLLDLERFCEEKEMVVQFFIPNAGYLTVQKFKCGAYF